MGCSTTSTMNEPNNKKESENNRKKDEDGIPERIPGKKREHKTEEEPISFSSDNKEPSPE